MACSSLPENVPSGRQKMIDELVQGREIANQLQTLLFQSVLDDGSVATSAEHLVSRIMESFTNTLFMLNRSDTNEAVVSEIQATSSCVDSPGLNGRKSEDSGESCRSVSTTLKDRRGRDKRRKSTYTWQRETSCLIDDGHAWRKYGQKMILKAKHHRSYFRCTHKYDQGCQAVKQVQKIQDNPPIYRITYYGHHTCRNLSRASELVLDCPSPGEDSSVLVSFNNANLNNLTSKQAHPFLQSYTSVKHEEFKDEIVPARKNNMMLTDHNNQTSFSDYFVSPDQYYDPHIDHHDHDDLMAAFDLSAGDMPALSSNLDDIHGDVMSGVMSFSDDDLFQHFNF